MSSRTRRALLALAALVIVVAVIVTVALLNRNPLRTAVVQRGSLEATIETVGRLIPRDPSAVRSSVSGIVALVAVSAGDTVQAGDVLVELEPGPFRAALQQAENQVTAAESALNAAEQQGGSNPTPAQLTARLQADQNLRDARKAVDDAQAALVNTLILSPISGTVLQVETANGAPVTQGTEVAQVANLQDVELRVDLDEIDLPHVSTGSRVSFTLDAYPGRQINGTLTQISPTAQTTGGTTTFEGTVAFAVPNQMLIRPGMNANVSIQTALRQNVLLIPESALRTVGQRTFVTVVTNGGTEEREIQVGLSSKGDVEVASGLREGERVVIP